MKTWITVLFLILSFISSPEELPKDRNLNTVNHANYLTTMEKEVINEINLLRSNPKLYAEKHIAPLAKYYDRKIWHYPGDIPIQTKEGVKALHECVRELKEQPPLPVMHPNKQLTLAANDHQKDQEKSGETGHIGRDCSDLKERIERYGNWQVRIAENIAYGNSNARQVIIFLLIDDGIKSRGHRANLLHPELKSIGIACGSHPRYKTMCVMDFAGGIEKNSRQCSLSFQ